MFYDFLGLDPDPENLTGSVSDQKVRIRIRNTACPPVFWIRIQVVIKQKWNRWYLKRMILSWKRKSKDLKKYIKPFVVVL